LPPLLEAAVTYCGDVCGGSSGFGDGPGCGGSSCFGDGPGCGGNSGLGFGVGSGSGLGLGVGFGVGSGLGFGVGLVPSDRLRHSFAAFSTAGPSFSIMPRAFEMA
jgi:hypothetical protein